MRRKWSLHLLAALALLIPLSWPPAGAQITTGGINGRIVDEKGDPLPGVLVTARNRDTGIERAVTTDSKGEYQLLGLPPATYIVQATFTGYGAPLKTIVVNLGQKVPLNFEMKPGGGLKEELSVTAEPPIVNTTKNEVSTVVTETQIRAFPLLNRDYTDLASLAPGVKQAPSGQFDPTKHTGIYTPFTTGGTAGRNLNISIDGADNNDNIVGFFVGGFSAEAIQEFEVVQDEYKAEYGRSLGGVVNVITKSGTNDFGGSVFGTYRDQGFRDRNFSEEISGVEKSKSDREQYGFSLGGPIIKDRLFYFIAAEKQQETNPGALSPTLTGQSVGLDPKFPIAIASPGTVISHDFKRTEYNVRVDWSFAKNQMLSARWSRDFNTFQNDQGAELTNQENQGNSQNLVHQALLSWQWNIRGNMINEFKLSRLTFTNAVTSDAPDQTLTLDYDAFELGRNVNTPQKTVQNKYQMRDDFTWILGRHSFKGGIEGIRVDVLPSFLGPPTSPSLDFTFNSGVSPNRSLATGADPNHGNTDVGIIAISDLTFVNPGFIPGTRYEQYAGYFQDDWEINDRWRLNLGLRVDSDQNVFRDTTKGINKKFYDCLADPSNNAACGRPIGTPPPSDPNTGVPLKFPSFNNTTPKDPTDVSPRIGFVYRVNGEDKDVLRGSWGLFYDKFLDNLGIFMRQNLSPFVSPVLPSLAGCDITTDPNCDNTQLKAGTAVDSRLVPLPVDFTLANWLDPNATDPNGLSLRGWFNQLVSILGPATFQDSVFMPGPDWKTPYTSAFSVGWGHVFTPRLALDTNLIYREGFHQLTRQSFRGRQSGRVSPFPVDTDPNGNAILDPNGFANYGGTADFFTTQGKTKYVSLQMSLKGRFPSFDFGVNLNLSEALGTQDNAGTGPTDGGPTDIFEGGNIRFIGGNLNSEWGRITGDQFIYVNAFGIYRFPMQFQAAGSLTYGSKTSFQGFAGVDLNGDGFNSANEYAGTRGSGLGDDYMFMTLRGSKFFDTGSGTKLEAYLEVYNLTNRVNHGVSVFHQQLTTDANGAVIRNPDYQKPTGGILGEPRSFQIGLRFTF